MFARYKYKTSSLTTRSQLETEGLYYYTPAKTLNCWYFMPLKNFVFSLYLAHSSMNLIHFLCWQVFFRRNSFNIHLIGYSTAINQSIAIRVCFVAWKIRYGKPIGSNTQNILKFSLRLVQCSLSKSPANQLFALISYGCAHWYTGSVFEWNSLKLNSTCTHQRVEDETHADTFYFEDAFITAVSNYNVIMI